MEQWVQHQHTLIITHTCIVLAVVITLVGGLGTGSNLLINFVVLFLEVSKVHFEYNNSYCQELSDLKTVIISFAITGQVQPHSHLHKNIIHSNTHTRMHACTRAHTHTHTHTHTHARALDGNSLQCRIGLIDPASARTNFQN